MSSIDLDSTARLELLGEVLRDPRCGQILSEADPRFAPPRIYNRLKPIEKAAERAAGFFIELAKEREPGFRGVMAIDSGFGVMAGIAMGCRDAYSAFCTETPADFDEDQLLRSLRHANTKRIIVTVARMRPQVNIITETALGIRSSNYQNHDAFQFDSEQEAFEFKPSILENPNLTVLSRRLQGRLPVQPGEGCLFARYLPSAFDTFVVACAAEGLLGEPAEL